MLGAPFFFSGEDLTDFNQLVPLDHAPLNRIVNIRLLILNRLLDRNDTEHVASRQCGIVGLPSFGCGESPFYQADVTTDDGRNVLARFEPVAVEDRYAGV